MSTKGVILAGGSALRMGSLARAGGKHILPIGDMPMICHPLRKLVQAGVTDILIVTSPAQISPLTNLLGSSEEYGCDLSFKIQAKPGGIAQALGLARNFVGNDKVVVILGDNVWSDPLPTHMVHGGEDFASVCIHKVPDPHRYGVPTFDDDGLIINITEKPSTPESNFAVCGIYAYPPNVFKVISEIQPSNRGEIEITDVNNHYVKIGKMYHYILDRWWIDAGEPEAYHKANELAWISSSRK